MAEIKFTTVNDLLTVFGKKFVDDLGKSLDHIKDASGNLKSSIHFRTKIFSEHYEFNLLMEDYYKYVDEGVNGIKGNVGSQYSYENLRPPVNVILKWLTQHNVLSKLKERKKKDSYAAFGKAKSSGGLSSLQTVNIKKIKSLAYAITEKIYQKGLKPTYFFSSVFDDGRMDKLKLDLGNGLKKDILIEIREIAKEK